MHACIGKMTNFHWFNQYMNQLQFAAINALCPWSPPCCQCIVLMPMIRIPNHTELYIP